MSIGIATEQGRVAQSAVTLASTTLKAVTSGGAATKGNYVELDAAIPFITKAVIVYFRAVESTPYLWDLAIGAAGSEVIVVPDLPLWSASIHGFQIKLPLALPAGARLAARSQNSAAAKSGYISVRYLGGSGPDGFQYCEAYGVDAANTRGTLIDPGGSANTKGAYSQMTAACGEVHAIILCTQASETITGHRVHLVDLARGGAGAEKIVLPDLHIAAATYSTQIKPLFNGPFPVAVRSGERLAMRSQCSSTTQKLLYGTIHAFI